MNEEDSGPGPLTDFVQRWQQRLRNYPPEVLLRKVDEFCTALVHRYSPVDPIPYRAHLVTGDRLKFVSLINLTPHPIKLFTTDTADTVDDTQPGKVLAVIQPSGQLARLAQHQRDSGPRHVLAHEHFHHGRVDTPVPLVEFSAVQGLPDPVEGVFLIVSLVTALAVQAQGSNRHDLLVPYAEVRREGTVYGCRALARPVSSATLAEKGEHR